MYGITFQTRSFQPTPPPPVTLSVTRLQWKAEGGPSLAILAALADNQAARQLLPLLRCPVLIWDRFGRTVWTGYVASIEFAGVRYDLGSMANQVKAMYTFSVNQGTNYVIQQFYTSWVNDSQSQVDYGLKQKILSAGAVTADQAASKAAQYLAQQSIPRPAMVTGHTAAASQIVTITCKGWYDTLSWEYYANPAGIETYTTDGVGLANLGDVAANTKIGQSFQPSTPGWDLDTLWLKFARAGSPVDYFTVNLYADSGGLPSGPSLTSGMVAGSTVGLEYSWIKVALSPVITLGNSTYWIVLSRSTAVSPINYYKVKVNETCGYPNGQLKLYNGTIWSNRTPDADLNFTALGHAETTAQVAAIADQSAAGQFLAGVSIENTSGLFASPYRAGLKTGLQEIRELLASGTSAGEGLLANVDKDRILHIFKRPSAVAYVQAEDGIVRDLLGQVPQVDRLVGQWVKIERPGIEVVDTQFISQLESSEEGKISIN